MCSTGYLVPNWCAVNVESSPAGFPPACGYYDHCLGTYSEWHSWEQYTGLWALTIMPTLSLPLKKYSGELSE